MGSRILSVQGITYGAGCIFDKTFFKLSKIGINIVEYYMQSDKKLPSKLAHKYQVFPSSVLSLSLPPDKKKKKSCLV